MKIKPMLTRLQNTIGRNDLIEQMVLAPGLTVSSENKSTTAKFIVGYNSSRQSHTALDIALCIAHQARLASNMQITVQAVYVVEDGQNCDMRGVGNTQNYSLSVNESAYNYPVCDLPLLSKSSTSVLTEARSTDVCLRMLEQTDAILCQARILADEWQTDFSCLLRFGCVADELKEVIQLEGADILFLGCNSVKHPIIQSLGTNLPCAILGIPNSIE